MLLSSAFAIFIGKHLFGGIGQNIFNPAMLARVPITATPENDDEE